MSRTMVVMWDCYGLETVRPVDDIQQQRMWATLKGDDPDKLPMPLNLVALQIRAQANLQRNYEIYLLETEDSITVDDIVQSFESAPQEMADTVRRIGHRVYGRTTRRDEDAKVRIR